MVKVTFKWLGNILLILLVTLFLTSLLMSYQSYKNPDEVPTFFGYKIMTVLTGSMRPALEPGDLVIDKKPDVNEIKVNDIITFKQQEKYITHRVIGIVNENGQTLYQTKGDANNVEDDILTPQNAVVGGYAFHIPKAGLFLEFARGKVGVFLLIVLPALLIVFGELFGKRFKKTSRSSRPYPTDVSK